MKYLIFETDNWHTHSSKNLIAVCSTFNTAISLLKKDCKAKGNPLSEDDIYNLQHIKQTQNFEGDGEFVIEEMKENVISN